MVYITKLFFCGTICSLLFPPFFLFPLGFIIFPYLYFFFKDQKIKNVTKFKKFIFGISFGLGLNLIVLYWVTEPFSFYPSTINYAPFAFLLIFYISIYFGLVFLFLDLFKNDFSKLIMIPILFVIAEIMRENFLFGFPWITFASIASGNYYLLQIVYFIGTNGLSYFLLFIYLVPVSIFLLQNQKTKFFLKIYLIVTFVVFFVLLFLIFIRLNFLNNQDTNVEIKLSLNQLNISQTEKINDLLKDNKIKEIIKNIKKNHDTIHIFSETDYPYLIEKNNIVDVFQKHLINNNSIIIGGIRKNNQKYYNSLYFITTDNFQVFDKKKLVPFGEFLPFRKILSFLEAIVGNVDLEEGQNDRFINTAYNFNFIPVICYEIIFFNDLLSSINHTSPLLINITNDAWFGSLSGPYQHFYLSRIRSVEFNKFLIRVSNNGVTTIIDNYGKIMDYLPLNKKGIKYLKIKTPSELSNLYNFHILIYLIIITLIIIAITIEAIDKRRVKI